MSDEQSQTIPKIELDTDPKPFRSLLSNERDLHRVFEAVQCTIWRSFGTDIQREPFKQHKITKPEIKRRFKICEAWFRRARGDLGYSLERTLDMMGHALRCELDGRSFDPTDTGPKIWTPT